jgi:hypothetical protein
VRGYVSDGSQADHSNEHITGQTGNTPWNRRGPSRSFQMGNGSAYTVRSVIENNGKSNIHLPPRWLLYTVVAPNPVQRRTYIDSIICSFFQTLSHSGLSTDYPGWIYHPSCWFILLSFLEEVLRRIEPVWWIEERRCEPPDRFCFQIGSPMQHP